MMYPGRLADTMEEHRALVDSIAARDVERAQNAARIHLEKCRAYFAQKTWLKVIMKRRIKNKTERG